MKELITYNDRRIEISAYSGRIERSLVLYKFSRTPDNPPKLEDIFFIVNELIKSNIPLENLTQKEKVYILYSIRALSVSDSLPLNFTCPNCNTQFSVNFNIGEFLKQGELNHPNLHNFYTENYDELFKDLEIPLSEYDSIIEYIEKTFTKFNYERSIKCVNCKIEHPIDLSELDILTSSFSSFDVMGFYHSINSLIYYGKCSAYDLMEVMLPFERELLTSYIQDEIEKAEKAKNGTQKF